MNCFINISNHPSALWSDIQRKKAEEYGQIIDMAFPDVSPDLTEAEVSEIGTEYVKKILSYNPQAVMCQGEFTLTFDIVTKLKKYNVKCLSACSERNTVETKMSNGSVKKETIFSFIRFREF